MYGESAFWLYPPYMSQDDMNGFLRDRFFKRLGTAVPYDQIYRVISGRERAIGYVYLLQLQSSVVVTMDVVETFEELQKAYLGVGVASMDRTVTDSILDNILRATEFMPKDGEVSDDHKMFVKGKVLQQLVTLK